MATNPIRLILDAYDRDKAARAAVIGFMRDTQDGKKPADDVAEQPEG